ncbi:hypothetical protein BDY21DRAFT_65120 [Lineolata rhizophorae]|uniref:Secreted protein n=1 Tax=Lineolata rhizophorae TaxID=578093 RepID=A0A6A6NW74_9PEZI|nr:hypothetical protein BDY21DRAFT_65120 [Lineolata rhizophorae]
MKHVSNYLFFLFCLSRCLWRSMVNQLHMVYHNIIKEASIRRKTGIKPITKTLLGLVQPTAMTLLLTINAMLCPENLP